ncbi:hypothetical protein GTY54_19630 [Streptomyces sp. SID625]|nr:hypothetical protein [Streptomyces sp. SID625]
MLHQRQNCAPHFAEIELDFEPAAGGFAFEVPQGLTVDHEPVAALSRFFAAAAAGVVEQLSLPEHGVVVATRVVLRHARADPLGSHELAFKIAGYLAAGKALERERARRRSLTTTRRPFASGTADGRSCQGW